ncbi:MAG: hypothetical protein JWN11_1307 [Hyphomicrobiales bacterium]|nr:hypothetical protein [Hyphomicrobiales bacterium]
MARTLTKHADIREWAEGRSGFPMMEDVPDGTEVRSLLEITFGQHALNADRNEGPDRPGGFQLVSWDDWFAEFDRQQLALRVPDEEAGRTDNDFEFVTRH